MNRLFLVFLFAIASLFHSAEAQTSDLHHIRGTVVDEVSQQSLIGALVYLVGAESNSTVTDENGDFRLENVQLGRHRIVVSYLGYTPYQTSVEVKSGKELVLNILMQEAAQTLDEVVVTAQVEKSKTVNAMSYASTRTFSVEESNKFAGAVEDPARMAQSFAGVVPTNDGNNYISIRGNHPSTLLYRMEGIDIPNPNHFGDVASSGGGVSVLSSQMLTNSDFSSGAFASEYGNAVGGVFDLKMRKGNNSRNEYTLKAGFLGIEAAVEGPFSKKYKGSYLINYRYSTLSLIHQLGVDLSGVLNYSDLSYHVHLPVEKLGQFSLFGINGWSNQNIEETLEDIASDKGATSHFSNGRFLSNMSVNGLKYTVSPNKNGFLTAILALSTTKSGFNEHVKTDFVSHTYFSKFNIENTNDRLSTAIHYTQKISPSLKVKSGVYYDQLEFEMLYNDFKNEVEFTNLINNNDKTSLWRAYSQWQWQIGEKWSTNLGFHYTKFMLNEQQIIEPRANITYAINPKSNISLAYGHHSQQQPLIVYFIKSAEGDLVNKNLGFTQAKHLVLTYHYDLSAYTRIKTELYHQDLTKLPVGTGQNSHYAIINQQFFFPDFELVNRGRGRNIGLELTLEQFMHHNFYYLVTASVFDSKYKTPTTTWQNTRYNTGYTASVTLGKEWTVGKSKRHIFGLNIKSTLVGGQWDTPIDREASQQAKEEVRDNSRPFSTRLNNFYKLDIGIRYKRNKSKFTSTLALDLMNATNHRNIGGITYDIQNDTMDEWTMMPFIPVLSYKVEF